MSLGLAYSMKRKAKKMADGGSVSNPGPNLDPDKVKQFVKGFIGHAHGGEVKGVHHSDMEIDRPESAKEKKWAGESSAGRHLGESDLYGKDSIKKAKGQHYRVLGEMKSMPKPKIQGLAEGGMACKNCGYAEGGEVKKGVHTSGGYSGLEESGKSTAGRNYERSKEKQPNKYLNETYKGRAIEGHKKVLGEIRSMPKPKLKGLAHGGAVEEDEMLEPVDSDLGEYHVDPNHAAMDEDDMVSRIIKKRMYSKGGQVANDTHPFEKEFEDPNEFDDLVLRDDLESSYTGKNSGDELGSESEDHDRSDIVARIMASRRKKDRNPKPA